MAQEKLEKKSLKETLQGHGQKNDKHLRYVRKLHRHVVQS